ncbi:response regulator transcription factor [Halalkalibacter urbisdiaboli]|uniref:response regulator transcription factor n=1 Tax=Halalkalibacter urbisdiaboli TaxID=1960589 RepID=UPI000B445425|nr:response regulator transcription factor [Halalkalibacter urbisdiaboli]
MSQTNVLIVDDEWNMRNLVRLYLSNCNYEVHEAKDGYEALTKIDNKTFDLVILDVMMPGLDGWAVCKKIRETKQIPILMLTARTDTKDKVHGLTIGADDYLVKPFDPNELSARVQALLRRAKFVEHAQQQSKVITVAEMVLDVDKREVYIHDSSIDLTPKEFDLLQVLIEHPGRVYSRDVLLEQIWGYDYIGDVRTVDTHVKNVREKVRKAGLSYNPIETVWGVGYKHKEPEKTI